MILSTKGRYALIAMTYMARKGGFEKSSVSEISMSQGISQSYLEQLFMRLRKANILKSVRGAGGGFTLNRHPTMIRIQDIMKAVDENFQAVDSQESIVSDMKKTGEYLLAEKFWEQFSSQLYLFMHKITLEDIASDSMEPCQAVTNFAESQ
jgi:Rrf2 family iron-sulfur cluster assembly transcriptional regulator